MVIIFVAAPEIVRGLYRLQAARAEERIVSEARRIGERKAMKQSNQVPKAVAAARRSSLGGFFLVVGLLIAVVLSLGHGRPCAPPLRSAASEAA